MKLLLLSLGGGNSIRFVPVDPILTIYKKPSRLDCTFSLNLSPALNILSFEVNIRFPSGISISIQYAIPIYCSFPAFDDCFRPDLTDAGFFFADVTKLGHSPVANMAFAPSTASSCGSSDKATLGRAVCEQPDIVNTPATIRKHPVKFIIKVFIFSPILDSSSIKTKYYIVTLNRMNILKLIS